MTIHWPFILRSTHDAVRTENWSLRDALREANAELRRHRLLIGQLKAGHAETTTAFERVLAGQAEQRAKT